MGVPAAIAAAQVEEAPTAAPEEAMEAVVPAVAALRADGELVGVYGMRRIYLGA